MKYLLYAISLLAFTFKAYANPTYIIDETVSTVSFSTIKKQYVIEPAVITGIAGAIDQTGTLTAEIPISSLDSGIQVRDERLRKLFFNAEMYPLITVSAKVPANVLQSDKFIAQLAVPFSITVMDTTKDMSTKVNLVKVGDTIAVSTSQPIVINAAEFNIPNENLSQLAATVGNIPISTTVPVSFSLVLNK